MLDILQAFLAFAATMLALSTIVTTILEIISRLAGRRSRIFVRLLEVIYNDVVDPLVQKNNDDRLQAEDVSTFVKSITQNPLQFHKESSLKLTKPFRLLLKKLGAEDSDKVPASELLRRIFKNPEIMAALKGKSEEEIRAIIDDIEDKYDELCAASREYLKNSSRITSLLIGILLALSINIDAHRLLTYYIDNPLTAKKIAAQAETHATAHETHQTALNAAMASLNEKKIAAAAAKEAGDADATAKASEAAQAEKQAVSMQQTVDAARKKLDTLRAEGIPIGADFFPHCYWNGTDNCKESWVMEPTAQDAMTLLKAVFIIQYSDLVGWIFWAIFTGILIGLGGPFWYDAVRGAMHVAQLLRGRGGNLPAATTPEVSMPGKSAEKDALAAKMLVVVNKPA